MTAGSGKPPSSNVPDDPLLRPASDAGWDDPVTGKPRPAAADAKPADAKPGDAKPAAATPPAPIELASDAATQPTKTPPPASGSTSPPTAKVIVTDAPAADAPTGAAKPGAAASTAGTADTVDAPLLPATSSENELRAAVGAAPLAESALARKSRAPMIDVHDDVHDDELAPHGPRNVKTIAAAVLGVVAGIAIIAVIVFGRSNAARYVLTCEAERAVPQQGRAFPPWGNHALGGDAWHPLKIAPETRCQARETDDPHVLERWFLAMVLDQITAQLAAHDPAVLDDTEALLKQSLLLTRPAEHEPETLAAERTQQHKDIERLLGDVTYWRAAGKLRDAAATLTEAAKQFDAAAAQHPRHVTDATAWASYARKLADQLHAGPGGGAPAALAPPGAPVAAASPALPPPATPDAPATADAPTAHVAAPPGIALPVEPDKPAPATPTPTPTPTPAEPPPASTGGVLL